MSTFSRGKKRHMTSDHQEQCFESLIKASDAMFKIQGFEMRFRENSEIEWIRRSSQWKYEIIWFRYLSLGRVQVQFYLMFPPLGVFKNDPKTEQVPFEQEMVGDFTLPTFFFSCGGFVQQVLDSVKAKLPWFMKFETPEQCLRHLLEVTPKDPNRSQKWTTSPAFLEIKAYLEGMRQ